MRLGVGAKLGRYEILAPLGAGKTGEIYRARDTRLERTVAIRILPQHWADTAEARQRFERETRTISALNHPYICVLYDIGHEDGVDFLVLELLEGEALARRLEKGPLAAQELLGIGIAVADALAKAHKLGILHGNLKPANIILTKSGVKLLDFGLAKTDPGGILDRTSVAAPMGKPVTDEATIVGTVQYMAPEQLQSQDADARTDIFSLGEVLYEMATGKPPFAGQSRASLIAAILATDPPPIRQLQPRASAGLERVVQKCLAKDPEERWQSASDLASELTWLAEGESRAGPPARGLLAGHGQKREWLAWALAGLALIAGAVFAADLASRKPPQVLHGQIAAPGNVQFNFLGDDGGPITISPDGSHVVFSGIEEGKGRRLYLRSLDSVSVQPLPGTDNAIFPFWSPDGGSVAFFADGKLKRIEIAGGAPLTLCDAPDARGGSWSPDGVIVFTPTFSSGLFQVSANGGSPTELGKLDVPKYTSYRWPWFLPDGKHFLYLATNHNEPTSPDTGIFLASLDSRENRFLFPTLSNAIYVSGYVLFLRGNTLMAQSFDASSGRLRGVPSAITDEVQFDLGMWHGVFTASEDGTLMYQSGLGAAGRAIAWFDRSGRELGTIGGREPYELVQLSPDEKRVAFSIGQQRGVIWTYSLEHDLKTRLTFGQEAFTGFTWSPDGSQIAYSASRRSILEAGIFSRASSGSGEENHLLEPKAGVVQAVCDWSPDGRHLIFVSGDIGEGKQLALWVLPLVGDRKPFPYNTEPGDEADAQFSPDGRWVAYVSRETTHYEVYVAPFPWTGAKYQVSTNGGRHPRWRHDGKELFFQVPGGTEIMTAEVNGEGPGFEVGKVSSLFAVSIPNSSQIGFGYSVSRDGQRFVAITAGREGSMPLTLVQNWMLQMKDK